MGICCMVHIPDLFLLDHTMQRSEQSWYVVGVPQLVGSNVSSSGCLASGMNGILFTLMFMTPFKMLTLVICKYGMKTFYKRVCIKTLMLCSVLVLIGSHPWSFGHFIKAVGMLRSTKLRYVYDSTGG